MAASKATERVRVGDERTAEVYAEAFLLAAEHAGQLTEAAEDLATLVDHLFQTDANLEKLLASVVIGVGHKDELIDRAFAGKCTPIFVNFLHVLNHHGRLNLLRSIRRETQALMEKRAKVVRVHVETATPLSDDQRQLLSGFLQERLGLKPVLVDEVDPDLLGGFVLRVNDYRFDGSVRHQLQALRKHLIERSSHEIQSGRDRFCPAS
jgi:F-type H+-transporting ATPase subunit delta